MKSISYRNPLIIGSFLLTVTGFASRLIGFFYRIFLSRSFGSEGMGIYQLLAPILALSFALTAAGIQTAISKFVAGSMVSPSSASPSVHKTERSYLFSGMLLSLFFSVLLSLVLYHFSGQIAVHFLSEERISPLLRILAFSIPPSAIHACVMGYYYGKEKTAFPALCQLLEQLIRVLCVFFLYQEAIKHGWQINISLAVIGIVVSECASAILCLIVIRPSFLISNLNLQHLREISSLAFPLSMNRLIVTLLMSIESALIPGKLMDFGMSRYDALSIYGILTGMALPLVLFPNTITNSISVLLLPAISKAEAGGRNSAITKAIQKSIQYGFLIGSAFTLFFFLFGAFLGSFLFHNATAGHFITLLGFLCPMMYIAGTLGSILNGLGKTTLTFWFSTISLLIRLAFVIFLIPSLGIHGFIIGLLVSQLLQTLLCLYAALKYTS